MSKEDRKKMEKLEKERDRLEMQAMVVRMQERDRERKEASKGKAADSVVENQQRVDLGDGSIRELVPELRQKAREKYLKDREVN